MVAYLPAKMLSNATSFKAGSIKEVMLSPPTHSGTGVVLHASVLKTNSGAGTSASSRPSFSV